MISTQMCIKLDRRNYDINFVNGTFLAKPLLGRSSIYSLLSGYTLRRNTHGAQQIDANTIL